jgi:hypothetical protein
MKITAKTLKTIGITCSLLGLLILGIIIGYNTTHKENPSPLVPLGILPVVIGSFLVILSKKKNAKESKGDKG